ncbi:hypothetical protein TNCV_921071 [Trichonephila clavipes]|nr:hypothetical protein TNCV_921071 [Trichonephila clavipes]
MNLVEATRTTTELALNILTGLGVLMVKVTDSWPGSHEFDPPLKTRLVGKCCISAVKFDQAVRESLGFNSDSGRAVPELRRTMLSSNIPILIPEREEGSRYRIVAGMVRAQYY